VDFGYRESGTRLNELMDVAVLIGGLPRVRGQVTAVIGEASLGSGEAIESTELSERTYGDLHSYSRYG
jgi:hypothetical protein